MATLMGSLFFIQGDQGWSETYPLLAPDYATAASNLNTLMVDRQFMICSDIQIVSARVSDLTIRGDAQEVPAGLVGLYVPQVGAPQGSVQSNVVLNLRSNSGVKPHSIRPLHGLPQECVTGNNFNQVVRFITALTTLISDIKRFVAILTEIIQGGQKTFILNPISTCNFTSIWTRKIGRPFGERRGRVHKVG